MEVFPQTDPANRYYETFAQFKRACEAFFETIPKHKRTLRTLLRDNFQILGLTGT